MNNSLFDQAEEQDVFPPPGFIPGKSNVRGIELYVPANPTQQKPDIMDFKCPRCGATIGYHVEESQLVCDHCGYKEVPEETRLGNSAETFEFRLKTIERVEKGWGEARRDMSCQRCGGVVSVPVDVLTYTCPFCGSNKVIYRESLEDVLRPRYLIPFKTNPQECSAALKKWLGSSWMIPSGLHKAVKPENFSALYIPYWTFTATAQATWKASVAHIIVETYTYKGKPQQVERVVWRDESGKVERLFDNLLVPATTRLNMSALARMDSYDISDLILYEPRYLAGMRAQAYDFPLDDGWDAGRHIMRERVRQNCLDRASDSRVRNFKVSIDFSEEQWRYILVPVYSTVYYYDNKPYQVLINGQTGKIGGPRPIDWEKVWLVIAGILSPGFLLILVGWLFSPHGPDSATIAIGMFLFFVSMVISFFLIRQGQEVENV